VGLGAQLDDIRWYFNTRQLADRGDVARLSLPEIERFRRLRERFSGKPEFVVNFFEFIAQEVRELLAELGFRSLDEAIGQVDVLDVARAVDHWKAAGLDLSPILHKPALPEGAALRNTTVQDHGLDKALDVTDLLPLARAALEKGVTQVVFDRNGFDYHGRIAAVAQAAREGGLKF